MQTKRPSVIQGFADLPESECIGKKNSSLTWAYSNESLIIVFNVRRFWDKFQLECRRNDENFLILQFEKSQSCLRYFRHAVHGRTVKRSEDRQMTRNVRIQWAWRLKERVVKKYIIKHASWSISNTSWLWPKVLLEKESQATFHLCFR